jgi:small subunit ribosomal protein S1
MAIERETGIAEDGGVEAAADATEEVAVSAAEDVASADATGEAVADTVGVDAVAVDVEPVVEEPAAQPSPSQPADDPAAETAVAAATTTVDQAVSTAVADAADPEPGEEPAPEVAAPEVAAPEVAAPEVAAPEVAAPEVAAPEADSTEAAPADPSTTVETVAADADEPETDAGDEVEAPPAPRPPPAGDRPAKKAPKDIGDIPENLSADDFAAVIERTVFEFKEGDIVEGKVVRIDPDEVLVDIGFKSEGVIPSKELSIRNSANPEDVVTVGEDIEALVLQMEDENGRLVLSKKRAQYERAWGRIERVMHDGGTVNGPVIEVVKGGLIVDIGLRGFLPASLVDLRRVRDLQPFVGESIEAKVIELDKNRNNVVLSRRAYLEEAQAEQRQAFLGGLEPGDVRTGVVSSVVNFGAFVDLGGMDGLVHVSELSWQHVSHPGEIVNVGDEVQVKVLEVDRDRERISLSIRQTREDPWDEFSRDIELGQVIDGAVTKTVPFGAFVSVGEGVEGLVHVSEIALHHVESPELELSIGQQVRVKVTEIDADRRRVSLSIKQALPEWEERSTWSDKRSQKPRRQEFEREEEVSREPSFNADASLEAILQELKEKGIGRS